ncbi:hypothetical protein ABFS82_03G105500 [Erythranthe guttata]|uniref:Uncharacterized protein n=1 Tax=Erythranthe guttata TaxID=4155 RepID=A0A022Q5J6_ERYGU|nr:PREDICTED: uncharacterized protein LOC105974352 [Erythranthe guttata]EYU22899.1 hypothetical protein MIMGU_mgv1a019553mg [Erythranthe guttata]|eukprot:XP_012854889.1 PREDICTED: uncharacterized protein LOC105974352 [Erythranthe guttata]
MRSGYDDEDHHQIRINDNLQKRIYMPMFCRLSVKDVKLNDHYRDPISSGEPSSPKVTCIGQVKRNNRVTGYPSAAAAAAAATVNHHHHHNNKPMIKLNKLFSASKTQLLPSTAAAKTSTSSSGGGGGGRSGSRSCRIGREMRVINSRRRRVKTTDCDRDRDCVVAAEVVDIGGMDPPLPVVKRVPPPEVNIWKRRFNGVGLQIEQIHLPNNNKFEPPPTTV